MHRKSAIALLTVGCCTAMAHAAQVTASVTQADGQFTYHYALGRSATPIDTLFILVDSTRANKRLKPAQVTSPPGWHLSVYTGDYPDGQYSHGVTWWAWHHDDKPTGEAVAGFSFTTRQAPEPNPEPLSYILFSPEYGGGPPDYPQYEMGTTTVPDFATAKSP